MHIPRLRPLLSSTALLALITALGTVAAAPATPAPRSIDACGARIDEPGAYVLSQDIGPCPHEGVVISASDVTFKLAGHSIVGSSTAVCEPAQNQIGVHILPGADNVRVSGGTISHFVDGLDTYGNAAEISSLRLIDNCFSGAAVTADGNSFYRNEMRGGRFGLLLCSATNGEVADNYITGASDFAIELSCSGGSNSYDIVRNVINGNGPLGGSAGGIGVFIGSENDISDNAIVSNFNGILLLDGDGNRVERNDVSGSAQLGILVGPATAGNSILENTARGNLGRDLTDENGCGANVWSGNDYATSLGCGIQ